MSVQAIISTYEAATKLDDYGFASVFFISFPPLLALFFRGWGEVFISGKYKGFNSYFLRSETVASFIFCTLTLLMYCSGTSAAANFGLESRLMSPAPIVPE